ncbi:hypothetical protein ASG89_31385 [Paenibacillus sp. Soil766]|nr:hypothetical protein ASG89_31385 [Paenibacillus sp. Soil766]
MRLDVKSIIVGALIGATITTIFNVFIVEPLKMRVNGQYKTNKKASQKSKNTDLVVNFLREWQTVELPTTTQIQQSILSYCF